MSVKNKKCVGKVCDHNSISISSSAVKMSGLARYFPCEKHHYRWHDMIYDITTVVVLSRKLPSPVYLSLRAVEVIAVGWTVYPRDLSEVRGPPLPSSPFSPRCWECDWGERVSRAIRRAPTLRSERAGVWLAAQD